MAANDIEAVNEEGVDTLIAELDRAHHRLPEGAIHKLRQRRGEAIPKLIEVIRSAASNAHDGRVPEGNAHFYALYLLAEFKAHEALPAIIESISLPGDLPFDLFGDAITESLPQILAGLVVDPQQHLDPLVSDRRINEFVRWAAAEAYALLVRDGRISRDEAVRRLHSHLQAALANDDTEVVRALVIELTDLGANEAVDEIRAAFERDLIDPLFMRLDRAEQDIAGGERHIRERLASLRQSGIADTIAELERWYAFQPEPHRQGPSTDALDESLPPVQQPFVSTAPHVGRNDPCPCGSSKKFKKCCGSPRIAPR